MKKESYFHRVQELTPTRFWINNVTREQARIAIDAGAVGCTQNPSYTWKMLQSDESGYAYELMEGILRTEPDDNEVQIKLQAALVADIAKIFYPIYEATHGVHGYVSIQGDPFHEDTDSILRAAEYNRKVGGPNAMVKVPVTEEGIEAIGELIKMRIPINCTEVMSVRQAMEVAEIYDTLTKKIADPAPLYISHIAGIFDEEMKSIVEKENINISDDIVWQAGVSIAKKIYWMLKAKNYKVGLISGGARGLHHFTEMVGSDYSVTINWDGTADKLIEMNPPVVERFFQPTPEYVVDQLMEKVKQFRLYYYDNAITSADYEGLGAVIRFRESFERSWTSTKQAIEARRGLLSKK